MSERAPENARIVIVDDEPANVEVLEVLLAKAGYTNVVSTTDSSRAVGLCASQPPDLVLLDMHMPAPDGFAVMEQLKPWIEGRWFPILVLTADITPELKHKALASGAKDFLTKPLDHIEVLLRVRNLLEARLVQLKLRGESLELQGRLVERNGGSPDGADG
jgi:putative two-component system response regulator